MASKAQKSSMGYRKSLFCHRWLVALALLCVGGIGHRVLPNVSADDNRDDTSSLSAREILLKLFGDARGLHWNNNTNWLQDKDDVCTWYGITCYGDNYGDQRRIGHIQKINLTDNHLVGSVPHELYELPYIESIILRTNADLDISFQNIGEAQYLKDLIISDTAVKTLDGISQATSLSQIHLTDLGLGGTIPTELFQLTGLEGLFLNFNKFTGTLPTLLGLLTNLQELYMYENDLEGQIPSEIGKLSLLRVIALASNAFGGTLPSQLNQLTNVVTLAIQRDMNKPKGEGITGPLPALSELSKVTEIFLGNQKLSGSIPPNFLDKAPQNDVIKVDLSNNELSGAVPVGLSHLTKLSLRLEDNQISSVPETLCNDSPDWFGGDVGALGCSAFLCPPTFYSSTGRKTSSEDCTACVSAEYYGATSCGAAADTPERAREILVNFYNEMGGASWKNDEDWLNPAVDACSWYGVECSNGEVSGIVLKSNGLVGTVPTNIFSLPLLRTINLNSNSIDFMFQGIGSAANLEELDLSHTDISSLAGIEGMASTKVRNLKLSSNNIKGEVPSGFFSLSTLEELDLSYNKFSGRLPSGVGLLTNLKILRCYGNDFTGDIPTEIGNLAKLVELALAENNFSGPLPSELGNLMALETLSIHQTTSSNGLSGPLLSFHGLTNLRVLELNSNSLTGTLPPDLLKFTEKKRIELQLSDNRFEGTVPGAWASTFDELVVDLTGNLLTGIDNALCQQEEWMDGSVGDYNCDALLCPIGTWNEFGRRTDSGSVCRECTTHSIQTLGSKECTGGDMNEEIAILKELYYTTGGASWTNDTGWISSADHCSWLGVDCDPYENVVVIDLADNGLSGSFPSSIFKLPQLRELYLNNNQIDFRFDGIGQATSLRVLHISQTNLDSLDGVGEAKSLIALHLTDNDLTGSLPEELLSLSNLKDLYLNFNRLSGRIPTDISRLSNLEKLYLFHNRLEGQIPAAIGSLQYLKDLVLSGNAFTGTLPDELNDITAIEILAIEREGVLSDSTGIGKETSARDSAFMVPGAGIHGPLPSFNKLSNLKALSLGENGLTGTIPYDFLDGIADKSAPLQVSLVSNRLSGGVPPALTQFDSLELFLAGNEIDSIADGICLQSGWMDSQVGSFGCNALLCPPNFYAEYGRQFDGNSECKACPDGTSAPYYGSYSCVDAKGAQALAERNILIRLFSATEGFSWKVNTNWMDAGSSICTWYGITCVSADEESVFSIHLQENSLHGKIPTDIFRLQNLAEINFAHDLIEFDFDSIGNAAKLDYLKLDSIGLTSLRGLDAAANLKALNVVNNDFQGSFPVEIFSLSNLQVLQISDNSFPDGLPSQLASLGNLLYLSCSDCSLSGSIPSWIGGLTNLEEIELHHNAFNGTVPTELGSLLNLEKLDLADQKLRQGGGLTGTLPDFAALSMLKYIYLFGNRFSGPIPSTFLQNTDNSDLVVLDLENNELTGTIPSELTRISKLDIFLSNNMIEAIAPEICATSWNGRVAQTDGCDFILCKKGTFNVLGRATNEDACDVCPSSKFTEYFGSTQCGPDLDKDVLSAMYVGLGGPDWSNADGWLKHNDVCSWYGITCSESGDGVGRVTNISLGKNNLVGTVLSDVFELPFLVELDLRSNNIDISFEGILNAKKLETLYLSETNITSIDGIGKAFALKNLHLTDNGLTGTFPNELYSLRFLEKLYLNFNRFTGPLSPSIAMMTSLKELFLFHNSLTGSIPSELASLPNIEVITLGENEFSGSLPQEMNRMSSLRILSLQRETGLSVSGEGLNGQLLAFDGMPNLEDLYLSGNDFAGSIPSSFISGVANKSATVRVDLTNNQLQGSIPPSLADFDDLVLYLAGNMIDAIPDSICAKHEWMDGEVAVNCDALLCPPGSFNQYGRRVGDDGPCKDCGYLGSALYYGSTTCEVGNTDGLDERGILRQFYEATGGSGWYKRDNWDVDDADICTWYQVKCATVDGQEKVTELLLANNGLVGTVPPIVFHLPALKVLNLHNNSVDFTFQGINFATNLENLHLDATKITSLKGVGQAKALKVLHIHQNEFGGQTLPDEIFDLVHLESFLLSSSGFEGTISHRIGNLVNLVVLNAYGNDFSGEIPSEIGSLSKLEVLSLGENNFFGTLPATLNQLSSLQSFSLDQFTRNNAGVSGPLLSFSGLPKIKQLYLGSNSLTGTIPEDFLAGIAAKDDMINVILKANGLTGTLPASLSRFSKLYIDITENRIEAIDDSLCSMNGWMDGKVGQFQCKAILCPVGTFTLEGRQDSPTNECQKCTDDVVSPYLGSTSCATVQKVQERHVLEMLFLATGGKNWKQKDGWMDSNVDICEWYGISCRYNSTVESILLGSNNLVGTPPKEIFELPNLRFLWLYSNPINFSFNGIERATKLVSLLLDSTGLTSLEGIGHAPSLVDVDIRFNNLSGNLPSEIRNMHDLQSFSCSNNRLTGSIPSFSTNRGLVTLRLGGNLFTGALPSFSTLRDVTSLDVSGNRLTGTIPTTLLQAADKTDAIFIDLSSNQLTGTVPGELASFDDLTLYLRDNKLEGINPKLCGSSSWNDGDVGKFQCDGILCPPNSYSPALGRATQDGANCTHCDEAAFFGSSYCGSPPDSSSRSRSIGFVLLTLATLPLCLVI